MVGIPLSLVLDQPLFRVRPFGGFSNHVHKVIQRQSETHCGWLTETTTTPQPVHASYVPTESVQG